MSAYTTQHLAGTTIGIFSLRTTFTQESAMGIYLVSSHVYKNIIDSVSFAINVPDGGMRMRDILDSWLTWLSLQTFMGNVNAAKFKTRQITCCHWKAFVYSNQESGSG